jgi:hypothetical protein
MSGWIGVIRCGSTGWATSRVLKGGCRVEDLQLETTERFEACLAMYMILAWRVLYVLMVGHAYPEVRCDLVLSEAE